MWRDGGGVDTSLGIDLYEMQIVVGGRPILRNVLHGMKEGDLSFVLLTWCKPSGDRHYTSI